MLNVVVDSIRQATRTVVQNHPNRQSGVLFRPALNDGVIEDDSMASVELYGGLGVLDAVEDSEHTAFESLGDASVLIVKYAQDAAGVLMGLGMESAHVGQAMFLIEPDDDTVVLARHDVVMLLYPEFDTSVAYEIVDTESHVHIAGGTRRYVCEPRDELSYWFCLDEK
jgi:hypothetical protein